MCPEFSIKIQTDDSLGQLCQLELQWAFGLERCVDLLLELLLRTPQTVNFLRATLQVILSQETLTWLLLQLYSKILHLEGNKMMKQILVQF